MSHAIAKFRTKTEENNAIGFHVAHLFHRNRKTIISFVLAKNNSRKCHTHTFCTVIQSTTNSITKSMLIDDIPKHADILSGHRIPNHYSASDCTMNCDCLAGFTSDSVQHIHCFV